MELPETNLDEDVILMMPAGLEFPLRDTDSDDSDYVGQLRVDVDTDQFQGNTDQEES